MALNYDFYKDRFFSVGIGYYSQGVNNPVCLECLIETKYNIKLDHSTGSGSDGYGNNVTVITGYVPEKRVGMRI